MEQTTPTHALSPLLAPRSIALIGASRRRNSVGNDVLRNLLDAGFEGTLYPVNPGYPTLYGHPCYAAIDRLPEAVDLAIVSVPNPVLEQTVQQAIAAGARALLIFASAELPGDGKARIAALARAAGVPLCGANCMGFYNAAPRVPAFSALFPNELQAGGITCIAQSGSLLLALLFNDERLRFNLAVSSGQELVTTAAEFMDYALEQPSTRLIVLILEAVREPQSFVRALEKARRRAVPVIALKLARTEAGAQLAISHTGAIAGNAQVHAALFRRYGVISVQDMSELAATAILMSAPRQPAAGALSVILDSGGERELLVDAAADAGVRFAAISDATREVLRQHLDPGLEPINPLDAWGTGRNFEHIFETCLNALLDDADCALGMFVCDLCDELDLHAAYVAVCEAAARRSDKLLVVMSNYSAWSHRRHAMRLSRAGIPVLDGLQPGLQAVRHALDYRQFRRRASAALSDRAPRLTAARAAHWQGLLGARAQPLAEHEGYALLQDYGITVPRHRLVDSRDAALAAAPSIGYPLVLKTAAAGVLHKSDVGGVRLGLRDATQLAGAYDALAARHGTRMLLCAQIESAVEMAFGLVQDAAFGPFVMLAFGGVWIELLKDRSLAMAPVDADTAAEMIGQLRLSRVLDGVRGSPACDRQALLQAFVSFGQLAHDLGPWLAEVDLNPVLVSAAGAVAVDCLIIPRCVPAASPSP